MRKSGTDLIRIEHLPFHRLPEAELLARFASNSMQMPAQFLFVVTARRPASAHKQCAPADRGGQNRKENPPGLLKLFSEKYPSRAELPMPTRGRNSILPEYFMPSSP